MVAPHLPSHTLTGRLRMRLCVGGPLHGRYLPEGGEALMVDPGGSPWRTYPLPLGGETLMSAPRAITYRRRRLVVPGWRFVLDVYTTWPVHGPLPDGIVLPGFVTGVPGERCKLAERPTSGCVA